MLIIIGGAAVFLVLALLLFFMLRSKGRMLKKAARFEAEGRVDDAYLAYESVISQDPGNLDARWRLSLMAIAKGAYPRAVNELQALLVRTEYPDRVHEYHVHFALGKAFLGLDLLSNAFISYYKGLQINPAHPEGNLRIGQIYAGQQKNETALRYMKTAVRLKDDFGEAWYFLGLLQAEMGDFQSAVQSLEKASRYSKDLPQADLYLGMFYKDRKMFPDALRRLQKVVRNSQDPAVRLEGYRLLGLCYKESGLIDDAITNYEVAANDSVVPPGSEKQKDMLYNLGMAYTKKGDGQKAMQVWNSLRDVDGSYKDVNELIMKGKRGFDSRMFEHALASWERINDRESSRLKSSGLLRASKRFDIDKVSRELGGELDTEQSGSNGSDKPRLQRFVELNNKQFVIVSQKILKLLGFDISRTVSSSEDPDFEEGKAVAFVASRLHPRTRKNTVYLVQIRRWTEKVGPISVGNCLDMMQELGLENSIFFVSSTFTDAALNVVQRDGRVQLVDGTGLSKVLRKILK